jgi:hypothetical protein
MNKINFAKRKFLALQEEEQLEAVKRYKVAILESKKNSVFNHDKILITYLDEFSVNERFVKALASLLDREKNDNLLLEVLCVITEIARDNSVIVGDDIISKLKKYLQFGTLAIRVQAATVLAELACRREYGATLGSDVSLISVIHEHMENTTLCSNGRIPSESVPSFRAYTQLLDNLFYNRGSVSAELFQPFLNYFRLLMQHDDEDLRRYCCSGIAVISCRCNPTDLKLIISSNIIPEMLNVIPVRSAPDIFLILQSLTLIWNISSLQEHVGYLLSVGVLSYLSIVIEFPRKYPSLFPTQVKIDDLFGRICGILTNIINGDESHIREVISYHFFPKLMKLLITGGIKWDEGRKVLIGNLGSIGTTSIITVEELQALSRMPCSPGSIVTSHSCLMVSFLLKVVRSVRELEESSGSSFSPTSLNRFQYSTACIEMVCKLGVFTFQSEF